MEASRVAVESVSMWRAEVLLSTLITVCWLAAEEEPEDLADALKRAQEASR